MTKRSLFITVIIVLVLALVAASLSFAYYYYEDNKTDTETFGEIDVKHDIYFKNNGVITPPVAFKTVGQTEKTKIYEINISNVGSNYYINNLRVDFKVNSIVETYFRFRIIDTLTLKSEIGSNYRELSTPNEGIEYPFDTDDFYYDASSHYYYYKMPVVKETNEVVIPFLISGIEYDLKSTQYSIQFGIIIEAVQAVRGPEENWGLASKPWGGSWV